MAAVPRMRIGSWLLAILLVCAFAATALLYTWRLEQTFDPEAAPVTSITSAPHDVIVAPPVARAQGRAPNATPQSETIVAPPAQAAPFGLAAIRCATVQQRQRNPDCARGPSYGDAQGRDFAPAPVEGLQTRDGALGRALIRGVNARVENYALGEAQKYADPRQDPLYEEGTDPSTAALRPCPAGTLPRGDGRELRGRTCQPMR